MNRVYLASILCLLLGCPAKGAAPDEAPQAPEAARAEETGTDPTEQPDGSESVASLTETEWVLVELNGAPAAPGANGKAPTLTLQGAEPRASGFAGCNRFSGGYVLEGAQLRFPALAMTSMACPDGMEVERAFAKSLGATENFSIDGDTLTLSSADGGQLAKFSAKPE
ncbi:MAG: META domain-containing protein [Myxococcota bacterium]